MPVRALGLSSRIRPEYNLRFAYNTNSFGGWKSARLLLALTLPPFVVRQSQPTPMLAFRKRRAPCFQYAPLQKNAVLAPRLPVWRSSVVVALLTAGFAALAGRALWVQIVEHEFHAAQGEKRHRITVESPGMRGAIVDRHGALL